MVPAMACAAIAAGADGLLVEVHGNPKAALSDAEQSLTFEEFGAAMARIRAIAEASGRPVEAAAAAVGAGGGQ
jgi:3-deoxy-7-phosphoheptulonate synthase